MQSVAIKAYMHKQSMVLTPGQTASAPDLITPVKRFFTKPFSPGWDKWMMDNSWVNPWRWGDNNKGEHTAFTMRPEDDINTAKARAARYIFPVSTYTANALTTEYVDRMSAKDLGSRLRASLSAPKKDSKPSWFDRLTMAVTGSPVGMSEGLSAYTNSVGSAAGKNRLWNLFKKNPLDTAGGFFEGATGLNRKWLWGGLGGLGALGALGIGAYLMRNRQQPVQYTQLPQYPMGSWQQNALNSYIRQPYMGQ